MADEYRPGGETIHREASTLLFDLLSSVHREEES
jgi:hypothetical protein